jgi:hypothetical protein
MFMFHNQTAGQNHNTEVANRPTSFENVVPLKYLEMTIIYQHYSLREIKSGLSLENACCHAVQNLFSPCPAPKHKYNIQKLNFTVVLYGSLTVK